MFNYFGAKHGLAATYQEPRYGTIVEPFAGAAGYTCHWLGQRSDLRAILIEKEPTIAAIWRDLLAMTPTEILDMPDVVPGERSTNLMAALASAPGGTMGKASRGDDPVVSAWAARIWPSVRTTAAWRRSYMTPERVELIAGDYRKAPDIEATWFIDPPYQHQGHEYPQGPAGIDYKELADWCQSRRGQVIVTEADPADWLPFRVHQGHRSQSAKLTVEYVWTNQPDNQLRLIDA